MSTNRSEVADVDQDRLTDQLDSLKARFPEVHEASDCIETVQLMVEMFGTILKVDGRSDSATADFDPRSPGRLPTYSLVDADKISKKLRALARVRGTKPVLSTWELVRRLAPELSVLMEEGCTFPQLAETLSDLGVDVGSPAQPSAPLKWWRR